MRILIEKGRDLLRHGAASLGAMARSGRLSPADNLPATSPRIRRTVLALSRPTPAESAAPGSSGSAVVGRPLGYSVRPRLVETRAPADARDADTVSATRFEIVRADPELLAFLGRHAANFHVFELHCAGLETLWRGDLARVHETRRPVLPGMTVYAGAEAIEIENLAFPVLESGRIVEIRGWFDEAYGNPVPSIDWRHVRHVRRNERSCTVKLPRRLTHFATSSGTGEHSVRHGEDPGIGARFGPRPANTDEIEGRRRLPSGA